MKLLSLIFISILASCKPAGDGSAFAEVIKVNTVNVVEDGGITLEDAKKIVNYSQSIAQRATSLRFKLAEYSEIPITNFGDYDWHTPTSDAQYRRFFMLKDLAYSMGCIESGKKCIFLLPPLRTSSGALLFGGVGNFSCSNTGFAIINAGRYSSHTPPRDRLFSSGLSMLHEILHTLKCSHKNVEDNYPINVMDEAAGRWVDSHRDTITLINETIDEMADCTGYQKKKKRIKRRLKRCRKSGKNCRGIYKRYRKLLAATLPEVYPFYE